MSDLSGHLDEWEDAAKSFPAIDDMGELRARTARLAGFVRRLVPAVREQDAEIARLRAKLAEQIDTTAWHLNRQAKRELGLEATIARVEAALTDALDCQNTADPSERMRCAMCCNDHFADIATALAQPVDQEGAT